MLRVRYPQAVILKAQTIAKECNGLGLSEKEKDDYCLERCGLTWGYLSRIGKQFKHPSDRALQNLGYDVIIRDNATGEEIPLENELLCDYKRPERKVSSTKVFVGEPYRTSTLNALNLPMSRGFRTRTSSSETTSAQ